MYLFRCSVASINLFVREDNILRLSTEEKNNLSQELTDLHCNLITVIRILIVQSHVPSLSACSARRLYT